MIHRIWHVCRLTVTRWSRNDGNLLAASTAYYAAFSFFPLLLVLISALGFALEFSSSAQNAQQKLLELIAERTAPAFEREIRSILSEVQARAPLSGPVGLVIVLFSAIGIFSQLDAAFDRLWQGVTPHAHGIRAAIKNALWNRLKAFLTLLGLGVLLIVAFAADILLAALRNWTEDLDGGILAWRAVQWGVSVALNGVVFALIYRLLPRAPVLWRHAAMGGFAVAVVWQLGSQLLSRFVLSGGYSAYGVVGSFIAVMLWVYCASLLLFLGGQFVQVLGHPQDS
ncbi:MAG TPA: YihY/virulence factor BrkB family protein, partial [Pirellulales bacterium]|nr:YihY/virulence factor BrkB family protein [Pirellulales bacterium]